ncbi:MAG: hypothetical protein IKM61_07075 [Eubacteriaceae bacterium]|nr:hypothetical protein [Eubacteriaceae bacterium]
MKTRAKSIIAVLLALLMIIAFSSCTEKKDPYERVMARFEKYGDKENGEDMLFEELMSLPAGTLIEEMNAIIDSGHDYESLMYHAIALAENSEDIAFSYLLDEITDKNNTESTREALLEIYDHKQRSEGAYEEGFDEISGIITDDALSKSIRMKAILTMLEGNDKSREELKKCYDKVDSELQEYIDYWSSYY